MSTPVAWSVKFPSGRNSYLLLYILWVSRNKRLATTLYCLVTLLSICLVLPWSDCESERFSMGFTELLFSSCFLSWGEILPRVQQVLVLNQQLLLLLKKGKNVYRDLRGKNVIWCAFWGRFRFWANLGLQDLFHCMLLWIIKLISRLLAPPANHNLLSKT